MLKRKGFASYVIYILFLCSSYLQADENSALDSPPPNNNSRWN